MTHDELITALIESENEAADDTLIEALLLGTPDEQSVMLDALLKRESVRGLSGVVDAYDQLPQALQERVLANIKVLHPALRECGRSSRPEARLMAMKLIALGRQGKLTYVLSENLHDTDDTLSKAAVEAMVALARWVAISTRRLQKGIYLPTQAKLTDDADPSPQPAPGVPGEEQKGVPGEGDAKESGPGEIDPEMMRLYRDLMDQRGEIETAVARAIDVHRGKHGADLLRATLLLCDNPASKTLAILQTAKHAGQSPMVRRLQQPPASEQVEAFLLGASHGQLRSHFGAVFAQINEAPVLDAILRKTHWLKDHQLALCMHQVSRGTWWQEDDLLHDIERRHPEDACRVGEWLALSGMHDVVQDQRMSRLLEHSRGHFGGRLRLLRIAARRKRNTSVQLLRMMLNDPDERLVRMAAREIARRRPADFDNMLLQLMTNAPESVRRIISRSIGQVGFDNYWARSDRLDRPTRKQAGRAMLKILPDAAQRLGRRLNSGPVEQRIKAMQITQELAIAQSLREPLTELARHSDPRVRSKAVSVLGDLAETSVDTLLESILNDSDPRVRANAIEAVEGRKAPELIPLLVQRARSSHHRERANAIKALHRMRVGNIGPALQAMLGDERPEHRVSAMWVLKHIGWWKLLQEVGRLAKSDVNLRVRRYALGVLKNVADEYQTSEKTSAAG